MTTEEAKDILNRCDKTLSDPLPTGCLERQSYFQVPTDLMRELVMVWLSVRNTNPE